MGHSGVYQVVLMTAITLLVTPAICAADAARDCARVEDRAARLACFDALFGDTRPLPPAPTGATTATTATATATKATTAAQEESAAMPGPVTEPEIAPASRSNPAPAMVTERVAIVAAGEPAETTATTSPGQDQATLDEATRNEGRGFFDRRERVNFDSRIKAVRARDKQRMVFLLDNGEVWLQSSPRKLPIKKGDAITIKSGLIGGFMLRNQAGVGTRVSRIK